MGEIIIAIVRGGNCTVLRIRQRVNRLSTSMRVIKNRGICIQHSIKLNKNKHIHHPIGNHTPVLNQTDITNNKTIYKNR
jgi:hypothetical protein